MAPPAPFPLRSWSYSPLVFGKLLRSRTRAYKKNSFPSNFSFWWNENSPWEEFDHIRETDENHYRISSFNTFVPSPPFPYPLKILRFANVSENLTVCRCFRKPYVSQCFQGVEEGCIEKKWIKPTWEFSQSF